MEEDTATSILIDNKDNLVSYLLYIWNTYLKRDLERDVHNSYKMFSLMGYGVAISLHKPLM